MFQGNEIQLVDETVQVKQSKGKDIPYKVLTGGLYLVIEAKNGLVLMWDKKTTLMIKLSSEFKVGQQIHGKILSDSSIYRVDFMSSQGKLCGLCGNYDGNIKNDFTTSNKETVVEDIDFGNGWKASPTCPDAKPPTDSCSLYSHRYAWALKQCSILKSKVFASCHSKVGEQKLKPLQL